MSLDITRRESIIAGRYVTFNITLPMLRSLMGSDVRRYGPFRYLEIPKFVVGKVGNVSDSPPGICSARTRSHPFPRPELEYMSQSELGWTDSLWDIAMSIGQYSFEE